MNGRKTFEMPGRSCRTGLVDGHVVPGLSFRAAILRQEGPRSSVLRRKSLSDKGKFINKKKVRPEADYLKDDDVADERVAKNATKKEQRRNRSQSAQAQIALANHRRALIDPLPLANESMSPRPTSRQSSRASSE